MLKDMNKLIQVGCVLGAALGSLCACHRPMEPAETAIVVEDTVAKKSLQGIWADDSGDVVQFRAEGDSLYYPGRESQPLYFKVLNGQLMICGTDTVSYRIMQLDSNKFWYHSITGELIKLHRSEYELDSLEFLNVLREPIALYDSVVQKDSVVMFDRHRYRGYVYINPSTMRVVKTSYNENGIKIEQAFYDNVIHICVYEGKKSLYAKDFTKKDFEALVDAKFLQNAVLGDMDFIGVDSRGFWYEASLCIPDETSCYQVYIQISLEGEMSLHNEM